jgi:6-phosphogluconolactonase/glucosamine-6-phosphate isomerase/deaminase
VFLVSGADKAPIVAEAFGRAPHARPHPCELVRPAGALSVLLDAAAAGRL